MTNLRGKSCSSSEVLGFGSFYYASLCCQLILCISAHFKSFLNRLDRANHTSIGSVLLFFLNLGCGRFLKKKKEKKKEETLIFNYCNI